MLKAVASIDPAAKTTIDYTDAVFDEASQQWISDAEVAEVGYTALRSKAKDKHVSARLIVRRVKDMNPNNQSELSTAYRYHAVFTNSPLPMLAAEKAHRAHAIIEQVIADLTNGPLAHLPSGHFWANSAWLVCAAMASNLTRAAGVLASPFHAKTTTGTIRAQLITIPGRPARRLSPAPADRLALADGLGADGDRSQEPAAGRMTHPPRPTIVVSHAPRAAAEPTVGLHASAHTENAWTSTRVAGQGGPRDSADLPHLLR